jgi:hypothetical protein
MDDYIQECLRTVTGRISEEAVKKIATNLEYNREVLDMAQMMTDEKMNTEDNTMELSVPGLHNDWDKNYLQESFEGYARLTFVSADISNTHSLPNRFRWVIKKLQRQLLSESVMQQRPTLYFIGERYEGPTLKAFRLVGESTPVFSGRDYNRMVRDGKRFGNNVSIPLKQVNVKSDVMISTDVYDIRLTDIAQVMDRCGTEVFSYSLIVPTDLYKRLNRATDLEIPKCIPGQRGVHYWFSHRSGKIDKIHFDMGDSSLIYSHDFDEYLRLIDGSSVCLAEDRYCNVQIAAQCGYYTIFHAYLEEELYLREGVEEAPVEIACVEVYRYKDGTGMDRRDVRSYVKEELQVPQVQWHRLVTALVGASKKPNQLQRAHAIWQAITHSGLFISKVAQEMSTVDMNNEHLLMLSAILTANGLRNEFKRKVDRRARIVGIQRNAEMRTGGLITEIKNMFTLTQATFQTIKLGWEMAWENPTGKKVLEALSGKTFAQYLGIAVDAEFSPRVRILDEISYHRQGGVIHMMETDLTPCFVTPEREETSTTHFGFEKKEEEKIELEKMDLGRMPQLLVKQDTLAVNDYITWLREEMRDIEAQDLRVHTDLTRQSEDRLERMVNTSWSDATSDQMQITYIKVRGGYITMVYGLPVDAMYVREVGNVEKISWSQWTLSLIPWKRLECTMKVDTQVTLADGDYYTTKDLRVLTAPHIYDYVQGMTISSVPRFYEMVEGIPGFGKSYQIVKKWRPGVFVLTSSKQCQVDLLRDLTKEYGDLVDPRMVRTVTSALMNPCRISNVIYLDEFSLSPWGSVVAAITKICNFNYETVEIYLMGDREQIEFTSRRGYKAAFQFPPEEVLQNRGVFGNKTLRNPAGIVDMYAHIYSHSKLKTTNTVTGGVACSTIRTIEDTPYFKEALYIVYTQAQVSKLNEIFRGRGWNPDPNSIRSSATYTPESCQGVTYPIAFIVRPDPKVITPYESQRQFLVAISRVSHAVCLLYVPVAKEDKMIKSFRKMRNQATMQDMYVEVGGDIPTIHSDDDGCVKESAGFQFIKQISAQNAQHVFDCHEMFGNVIQTPKAK